MDSRHADVLQGEAARISSPAEDDIEKTVDILHRDLEQEEAER